MIVLRWVFFLYGAMRQPAVAEVVTGRLRKKVEGNGMEWKEKGMEWKEWTGQMEGMENGMESLEWIRSVSFCTTLTKHQSQSVPEESLPQAMHGSSVGCRQWATLHAARHRCHPSNVATKSCADMRTAWHRKAFQHVVRPVNDQAATISSGTASAGIAACITPNLSGASGSCQTHRRS